MRHDGHLQHGGADERDDPAATQRRELAARYGVAEPDRRAWTWASVGAGWLAAVLALLAASVVLELVASSVASGAASYSGGMTFAAAFVGIPIVTIAGIPAAIGLATVLRRVHPAVSVLAFVAVGAALALLLAAALTGALAADEPLPWWFALLGAFSAAVGGLTMRIAARRRAAVHDATTV